jgi:DUF4097 and DUF4098 domain-containing protein YvlB
MAEVSMKQAIGILAVCVLATAAFGFETTKNLNLQAAGLDKLEIDAGAGSLSISGADGLAAIEVEARIVVDGVRDSDMEGYIKDHVELELRKSAGTAVLKSHLRDGGGFLFRRDARIDLTVRVPRRMGLDVVDGSGALEVENIAAAVRIDDGSGGLRVSKIVGSVRIEDGSGEIVVDGVEGNLDIEDGSGEIDVRDVTGDVVLDDGSGGTTLRHIGGTVTVDDGSGSLEISDVGKDVVLRHKGSGGVDITGVKGKVVR